MRGTARVLLLCFACAGAALASNFAERKEVSESDLFWWNGKFTISPSYKDAWVKQCEREEADTSDSEHSDIEPETTAWEEHWEKWKSMNRMALRYIYNFLEDNVVLIMACCSAILVLSVTWWILGKLLAVLGRIKTRIEIDILSAISWSHERPEPNKSGKMPLFTAL